MSDKPTPEQIAKLPKWAQDEIKSLARQRDAAIRALNEYVDNQTESPFYTEDNECTGEQSGPTNRRRYIQAHKIEVQWRGVYLRVDANDFGQSGHGIRIQWSGGDGRLTGREVAFIPGSYQQARLVAKEDMR